MTFTMEAIGYVRGGRSDPIDDDWGGSRTTIELDATQVGSDALAGFDAFSHAGIVAGRLEDDGVKESIGGTA